MTHVVMGRWTDPMAPQKIAATGMISKVLQTMKDHKKNEYVQMGGWRMVNRVVTQGTFTNVTCGACRVANLLLCVRGCACFLALSVCVWLIAPLSVSEVIQADVVTLAIAAMRNFPHALVVQTDLCQLMHLVAQTGTSPQQPRRFREGSERRLCVRGVGVCAIEFYGRRRQQTTIAYRDANIETERKRMIRLNMGEALIPIVAKHIDKVWPRLLGEKVAVKPGCGCW